MNTPFPLEVQASFRDVGGQFVSRGNEWDAAPPYIIAYAAQERVVDGAELTLPAGYDDELLSGLRFRTGVRGEDVIVTRHKAAELARIGQQLLALDDAEQIEPPFTPRERSSVGWLIEQVNNLPE